MREYKRISDINYALLLQVRSAEMFSNKIAVITGGADGIDKCIAEEFQYAMAEGVTALFYYHHGDDKMSALHAKVLFVDGCSTLITSANLSYYRQH